VKFLLAEYWHSHIYAEPFFQRLPELGHEVSAFREVEFFRATGPLAPALRLVRRAQDRFRVGPAVARLNRSLVRRARAERPDVVFLFRGMHVFPETLDELKRAGAYVVGWQNDDPLGPLYPAYFWRHFLRGIPRYQRLFAYRPSNVDAFRDRGCPRVELLRSFYLRDLNHPVAGPVRGDLRSEVCFVGHWERDGRERYVAALLRARDVDFKLWGTLWERSGCAAELRERFSTIRPVLKEEYNLTLAGTKMALVFLSKLNRDTYTRRCFEIPAAGTFMLSEFTEDLASLFEPGREAEYFRSPEEMMDKVRFYLRHDDARRRIAEAGRERLLRDGHEALDRARQVVRAIEADLGKA
jgi:hypothetical protein